MITIVDAVGKGCKNQSPDVKKIQILLNASPIVTQRLVEDGVYGKLTFQAILQYQMSIFQNINSSDGVINPTGTTLKSLNNPHLKPVRTVRLGEVQARGSALGGHAASTVASKVPSIGKLTDADFQDAAKALGPNVEIAMIKAIAKAESGGRSGFNPAGLPVIAYEGHYFSSITKGIYDKTHSLLSYKYGKKAGSEWKINNQNQVTAWATLEAAMKLDRAAAYQSCSWGMFQVMGKYYKTMCGFSSIDAFVAAMKSGEAAHLKAFVEYCKHKPGLKEALADKDFEECAVLYNGEDHGGYDKIISEAYKKYSGG